MKIYTVSIPGRLLFDLEASTPRHAETRARRVLEHLRGGVSFEEYINRNLSAASFVPAEEGGPEVVDEYEPRT